MKIEDGHKQIAGGIYLTILDEFSEEAEKKGLDMEKLKAEVDVSIAMVRTNEMFTEAERKYVPICLMDLYHETRDLVNTYR
ncbi:hypothetical protein KY347_04010 [Candidatus Woesearchaeota archaeon]|nr:hypothetical protein [Candidatus Woesearchaeota archaeon]